MDRDSAWSKIATSTKTARQFSAERINRAAETVGRELDVLAPAFAPFAARWDAEADRRMALRTPENLKALMDAQRGNMSARSTAATARSQRAAARKASKNPFNGARRAARTADRAATGNAKTARASLKAARKNYPITLGQLAVRVHVAHTVPAGIASYVLSSADDWAVWPAGTSLGLIGLNAAALWLGRRDVRVQVAGDLSEEEQRLMGRLAPTHWVRHAEERGLSGTLTENPEITAAGIVCGVRLDGKWSAKALAAQVNQVRALLGMRTETRMEIGRGSHGDRALIVVRTRSASDGLSMVWTPDHAGIGVDEVTGRIVGLPLKAGKHILLAGRTGMGKSVSWRPLAMGAVLDVDWTAVVIDPKRQEAIGWQHVLRCVGQETDREERMARIYGVAQELTGEMHRRQGIATGSAWIPDGQPENRNLLVVIDEGAAIVRMSKQKRYNDVLDLFEELWSEARSVGFQFVWATQFPTKTVGVPAAVKENMSAFLSLTVNPGEAERAIFGETAQQEGWLPSKLGGVPGRAMLQFEESKPNPLRLWHVTDGMIAGLPQAGPWHSPSVLPAVPAPALAPVAEAYPALRLVKDGGDFPAPPGAGVPAQQTVSVTNRGRVLQAIQNGAFTAKAVAEATGINKGTVSREIKALVEAGAVRKAENGSLEVSA